jgi:hypothetical protein
MEMIRAEILQRRDVAPDDAFAPSAREAVAAHLCARLCGVGPHVADGRTKAFFRSSGQAWARPLN